MLQRRHQCALRGRPRRHQCALRRRPRRHQWAGRRQPRRLPAVVVLRERLRVWRVASRSRGRAEVAAHHGGCW